MNAKTFLATIGEGVARAELAPNGITAAQMRPQESFIISQKPLKPTVFLGSPNNF